MMDSKNSEVVETSATPPKRKYYIERNLSAMTGQGGMEKLTRDQRAVQRTHTMNLILTWPNWDIWPFKIAAPVAGTVALLPGYILNTAFRNALLLGHYAKVSSYMATMGLPSVICGLAHNLIVTTDILEQNTLCPVCLQVKSASIQLAAGFIYPAMFTPIANFSTASGIKNLYFPKIHKEPKEVLKYTVDVFKSVQNKYLAIGALQVVVVMGMTYLQQRCYMNTVWPILSGTNDFSKETRKKNLYEN